MTLQPRIDRIRSSGFSPTSLQLTFLARFERYWIYWNL